MKPTPITKKQFVNWFVVFTTGMALWATPSELLWGSAVGLMTIGNLILMNSQERARPLPQRDVFWIFVGIIVFAGLIVASKRWLPNDFGAPVAEVIRHPALVAPLWALMVWHTYRRYRISKTGSLDKAQPTN